MRTIALSLAIVLCLSPAFAVTPKYQTTQSKPPTRQTKPTFNFWQKIKSHDTFEQYHFPDSVTAPSQVMIFTQNTTANNFQ